MKISFIIPAHNEEELLPKCIESIERVLAGGQYDAEIIVVDNASTDHTKEVALKYPFVKVVEEPRKGLTRARQSGFEASSGDLIANIDADTMIPAGWIDTVLQGFQHDEHLVALSGPFFYYDLTPYQRFWVKLFYICGYGAYLAIRHVFNMGSILQGGNFVIRRSALKHIGGYDTAISFYGEDTDMAKRLHPVGKVHWTFKLPIHASGRRIAHEGLIRTGLRYATNFFSVTLTKKPWHEEYTDIRTHLPPEQRIVRIVKK